jgi:hypothetical protein
MNRSFSTLLLSFGLVAISCMSKAETVTIAGRSFKLPALASFCNMVDRDTIARLQNMTPNIPVALSVPCSTASRIIAGMGDYSGLSSYAVWTFENKGGVPFPIPADMSRRDYAAGLYKNATREMSRGALDYDANAAYFEPPNCPSGMVCVFALAKMLGWSTYLYLYGQAAAGATTPEVLDQARSLMTMAAADNPER